MKTVRRKWVIALIVTLVCIALGATTFMYMQRTTQPAIPGDIATQLNFTPLIVASSSNAQTSDFKISTMEDGVVLLTYVVTLKENQRVTISEYPQPSQFSDVPDFKDKFLENVIQKTTSVSSAGGTVILGSMAKQQNKQMAVMLEKGLVVFLVPSTELTEDEWRAVGDSLSLLKS